MGEKMIPRNRHCEFIRYLKYFYNSSSGFTRAREKEKIRKYIRLSLYFFCFSNSSREVFTLVHETSVRHRWGYQRGKSYEAGLLSFWNEFRAHSSARSDSTVVGMERWWTPGKFVLFFHFGRTLGSWKTEHFPAAKIKHNWSRGSRVERRCPPPGWIFSRTGRYFVTRDVFHGIILPFRPLVLVVRA